jgi:formylglycine-generating enzyme required for sulfatase activity
LQADLPVTCVDLPRAQAFCATLGGRVPTASEWHYAVSNASDRSEFPCSPENAPCKPSNTFRAMRACSRDEPTVGCAAPGDITTQGVCDLVSNVYELVEYTAGSGVPARCGGGFACGADDIHLLGPHHVGQLSPLTTKGFRCVR